MAIADPDNFDCFRRDYIAGMLADAAEAMPAHKRRQFHKFLKSLPTGSVFDDARKPAAEHFGEGGVSPGAATGFATHQLEEPSHLPLDGGF